jgi:hypothetical protein
MNELEVSISNNCTGFAVPLPAGKRLEGKNHFEKK